jgi:aspartokinase/homoserine dehydrogenase 1
MSLKKLIQNLIPEHLRSGDVERFLNKLTEFDPIYAKIKADQKPNHVLRYIGELSGDLQNDKGNLEVKLVSVPSDTALGGLKVQILSSKFTPNRTETDQL